MGDHVIEVLNTKKENDLIVHTVSALPETVAPAVFAAVNADRRKEITNHHTLTHLLHAALRHVLGTHVAQKGSLVSNDGMRFDFSHFSKVTSEELEQVEQMVINAIKQNIPLNELRNTPIETAKNMGAMALFGEKYGDSVRVVSFGGTYSMELCGGTHVEHTGRIGFFRVVSESAVASKKRLKEEFVPHKLKIKNRFGKQAKDNAKEMPRSSGSSASKRRDSSGSKEEKKVHHRKSLDADISKGDMKMRAALESYLSVSDSDGEKRLTQKKK